MRLNPQLLFDFAGPDSLGPTPSPGGSPDLSTGASPSASPSGNF